MTLKYGNVVLCNRIQGRFVIIGVAREECRQLGPNIQLISPNEEV
jgi:hypothetical protein